MSTESDTWGQALGGILVICSVAYFLIHNSDKKQEVKDYATQTLIQQDFSSPEIRLVYPIDKVWCPQGTQMFEWAAIKNNLLANGWGCAGPSFTSIKETYYGPKLPRPATR